MMLEFTVAAAELEEVGERTRPLREPWLNYEPRRLPGDLHTFTLRRDGVPVAATVGTIVRELTQRRFADPYRLFHDGFPGEEAPARPWSDLTPQDVLPCAVLMTPEYEAVLAGPEASTSHGVADFVAELTSWAKTTGMRSVAVLYVGAQGDLLSQALTDAKYDSVPLGNQNVMQVDWTDADGYAAGLSYKQRNTVRYEMRKFAKFPGQLVVRTLEPAEPAVVDLLMEHATRHNTPLTHPGAEGLVSRIAELFGSRTRLICVEDQGSLEAFSLFAEEDTELVLMLTGTRYESPHASEAHFQATFYEPAGRAPEWGITQISYGLGDDATKRRRGCRQIPTTGHFIKIS
ncbi:GNAT family N-acetyltransferase [Actinomadura sp. 7K507]|uniref:GNAT family N-acetyltransferase n=1 Tax=Actinomadura sp. 7K507 TaxID=2530365 RepID=UPI001404FC37|nr:GNAT family N-acetyltransferase [Actinomadura sp. 7K507]